MKHPVNWSSWKTGHLQSHSSWCVSVNWEFRKEAINSSRSWQIGILVIKLTFASLRERCLTHYTQNLVSSLLVETIAGQLFVLSEWKNLFALSLFWTVCCLAVLYKGHPKALISPWAFLHVKRIDDIICLIYITWIRVRTQGPWFVLLLGVVHIPVLGNSMNSNTL